MVVMYRATRQLLKVRVSRTIVLRRMFEYPTRACERFLPDLAFITVDHFHRRHWPGPLVEAGPARHDSHGCAMPGIDSEAALLFLRTAFQPADWVAVFLKQYGTGRVTQRVGPLSRVTHPTFQAWLHSMNRRSVQRICQRECHRARPPLPNARRDRRDSPRLPRRGPRRSGGPERAWPRGRICPSPATWCTRRRIASTCCGASPGSSPRRSKPYRRCWRGNSGPTAPPRRRRR